MRILFLGSPAFAVYPLNALARAGYDIVGVVTQPDRPAGRKRIMTPPPVKEAAQQLDLPIIQPPTLRDPTSPGQSANPLNNRISIFIRRCCPCTGDQCRLPEPFWPVTRKRG